MSKTATFNINKYGVGMGVMSNGSESNPQLNFNDNWIVENFFPIGTIHLTTDATNPAKYFGGIWEPFGEGRTLVCVDINDEEEIFSTSLIKGGEAAHTLITNELPSHRHSHASQAKQLEGSGGVDIPNNYSDNTTAWSSNYRGNSQPHNNLQPYITCYMWIRFA